MLSRDLICLITLLLSRKAPKGGIEPPTIRLTGVRYYR